MKYCPNCGFQVDPNATSCAQCGNPLEAKNANLAQPSIQKFCEGCGAQIHKEAALCPHCGYQSKPALGPNAGNALGYVAIFVGFFIPLVAWICGGIGLGRASKANNKTGKILNIVGLVLGTVMFFVFFYNNFQQLQQG